MVKVSTAIMVVATALALYGCSQKTEQAAPSINASMKEIMEPDAEKIWNIASGAYNAVGDGLEADKISDANWKIIADASRRMKERADFLATAPKIVVAYPNEPILGSQAVGTKSKDGAAWDAVGPDTVQGRVNAKLDDFHAKARKLYEDADAMNRASQTKDVALLYKIASGLDETCDSCHEPFWGTDEPPPIPVTQKMKGAERIQ
jgi:cytochrome c556